MAMTSCQVNEIAHSTIKIWEEKRQTNVIRAEGSKKSFIHEPRHVISNNVAF